MKIAYQTMKGMRKVTKETIAKANELLEEMVGRGLTPTLRQLYYQFVARNLFPADWADPKTGSTNNEKSYDRLGGMIATGRRLGMIDWDHIVDRTRNLESPSAWDSPAEIVGICARTYDIDWWKNQTYRPEVWVEKDALEGVIEAACRPWHCPYFSCRGYTSDSEIHSAAQRLRRYADRGQTPVVLHFGDHDPSGIDMTRDITERLALFARRDIEVRRLALTMDQVTELSLPPNPAKQTDIRYARYAEEFGDESWELDALTALAPNRVNELVAEALSELINQGAWAAAEEERDEGRRLLGVVSNRWGSLTGKL